MNTLYPVLAVLLLLTINAALVRMWCGPMAARARTGVQALEHERVAMVLLLAETFTASGLRDMVVLF
jgi:hypothetical protein